MGMLHKASKRVPAARACFVEALAVAGMVRAENIAEKAKAALGTSMNTRSKLEDAAMTAALLYASEIRPGCGLAMTG